MASTRCVFLGSVDKRKRWLRRYVSGDHFKCDRHGYHNARSFLDIVATPVAPDGDNWPHDDPRWPAACDCGYVFAPEDDWLLFTMLLFRRQDTGEEMTLEEAPSGAMWYADWILTEGSQFYRGPDGHCLVCKLPDGHPWHVDGIASNCTKPGDDQHKCWVRHGVPPDITVDKNGNTCDAGAGSILSPRSGWHGFLRNGELVTELPRELPDAPR